MKLRRHDAELPLRNRRGVRWRSPLCRHREPGHEDPSACRSAASRIALRRLLQSARDTTGRDCHARGPGRRGRRRTVDGATRRARDCMGSRRCRRRVRQGESREQAALPLLGRGLVPAVQRSEGDDLHPPGLHRAIAQFRPRLHRRRREGRAKARRALQRQRLPDDGAVHAGRQRDHALAGRGRARSVHASACPRHERRAAGEGNARLGARHPRCAREPAAGRLADARVVLVGNRREPGAPGEPASGDARAARQGVPRRRAAARAKARAAGDDRDRQGQGCETTRRPCRRRFPPAAARGSCVHAREFRSRRLLRRRRGGQHHVAEVCRTRAPRRRVERGPRSTCRGPRARRTGPACHAQCEGRAGEARFAERPAARRSPKKPSRRGSARRSRSAGSVFAAVGDQRGGGSAGRSGTRSRTPMRC